MVANQRRKCALPFQNPLPVIVSVQNIESSNYYTEGPPIVVPVTWKDPSDDSVIMIDNGRLWYKDAGAGVYPGVYMIKAER